MGKDLQSLEPDEGETRKQDVVINAYLELLFAVTSRLKEESDLATGISRQIHSVLGNLNATDLSQHPEETKFSFVSKDTSEWLFTRLMTHFEDVFSSVELAVSRCRTIVTVCATGIIDGDIYYRDLQEREAGIVRLLANVVNALDELTQSGLSLGLLLDKLVKVLTRFLVVNDAVAKYFLVRCKERKEAVAESKFDQLVDITQRLVQHSYDMISQLEVCTAHDFLPLLT